MNLNGEDALLPEIDIKEINLYEAMDNTMLIESLQKEIAELKARLNYIQNGNDGVFIPPENSTNRGED